MRCSPLLGPCAALLLAACRDDDSDAVDAVDTDGAVLPGDDDDDTDGGTTETGPNPFTTGGAETCVLLFGGNDRIRGPDEGFPLLDVARTMQAWVRTRYMGEQIAVSYGRPSPNQGFMIGTLDGYGMVRAGSGAEVVVGDIFVADDEWHHLAASFDGRLVSVTVDGRPAGAGPLTVETLEGDLVAGNTPTGDLTKPWIGWLDDVRLFYGVRSPSEIAADLEGESVAPEDVLLHWDFEIEPDSTGPGLLVPDGSGNGHEGTTGGTEGTPLFLPCR